MGECVCVYSRGGGERACVYERQGEKTARMHEEVRGLMSD